RSALMERESALVAGKSFRFGARSCRIPEGAGGGARLVSNPRSALAGLQPHGPVAGSAGRSRKSRRTESVWPQGHLANSSSRAFPPQQLDDMPDQHEAEKAEAGRIVAPGSGGCWISQCFFAGK